MLFRSTASSGLNIEIAEDAYNNVIANAGATLPRLDAVDERILMEAAGLLEVQDRGAVKWNKTTPVTPEVKWLGVLNSQDDLKPADADETWTAWPDLSMLPGEELALDSDGDGIPDSWEDANGLNKFDALDGSLISSNGYSNLENYLNSIGHTGDDNDGSTGFIDTENIENAIVISYSITNLMGQNVYTSTVNMVKNDIQYPSVLQSGIYIVTYYYENSTSVSEKMIF